jgi:hypothetical protein
MPVGFLEIRSPARFLNLRDPRRAACTRARPECVILGVAEGTEPSPKPPVRIFLGTEPAQYRAERVFVWSIVLHRDPSRVYEIHLMKDLLGFDRRGWTTGFTNYRFAVPQLAGGSGRAIFNDVDEAYVGDPADLFDTDMDGHGYLATSDTETSVMLIDCARMASVWRLESAQRNLKKQILKQTIGIPGIRGDLPPEWTARDDDFIPGYSKLQHWTTLHTQPWRPVPQRFVYQPNPTGWLWFDLKNSADAAGFHVFSAEKPSEQYTRLIERLHSATRNAAHAEQAPGLDESLASAGAETVVDYRLGRHGAIGSAAPADAVSCLKTLDLLPEEDVPWVIDDLFGRASRFVYASVDTWPRTETLADGTPLTSHAHDAAWWSAHFAAAADRHPGVSWRLALACRGRFGSVRNQLRDGVRRAGDSPRVWLMGDGDPAGDRSCEALADSLGWKFERKPLRFRRLAGLPNWLLGATNIALDTGRSTSLQAPWPDVVIASGRSCVPVARWVREQSHGRTRLVHVGPDGGENAELFDAVVSPDYVRSWPHPRRVVVSSDAPHECVSDPDDGGMLARATPLLALRNWIARRANMRPSNRRGTPRPQMGLEYLCARLIERGWVRSPRDAPVAHAAPVEFAPAGEVAHSVSGIAQLQEPETARSVKRLLGYAA